MRSIGHRVRPGLEIREGHDAAGYPGHRGPYESPRPNPRVQANDGANPYGGVRPRFLMSDDLLHETENTVYRYLIAISKLRLGILTEHGEGS